MAHKSTYEVHFRRRRDEKTNYAKRLALLKSGKCRFVARKTSKSIIVQLIEYSREGDRIITGVNSRALKKLGWKGNVCNTPSAYLAGLWCGMKAKAKGIEEAVFDMGLSTPVHGSVLFAALKGAVDAGTNIPCDKEVFPTEERIRGKKIAEYAKKTGKGNANAEESFNNVLAKIKQGSG